MLCRTCNTDQPVDQFPLQRSGGYRGTDATSRRKDCKGCTAAVARLRRQQYPAYVGSGKVTQYPPEQRWLVSAIRCRVGDAKARARKAQMPFDLDVDSLYTLYQSQGGRCAISGLKLSVAKGTPHVLSLDQIVAGAGYTTGNVQWVSWAVNRAKGDLSASEFMEMCQAIIGRCNDYPSGEYTQVGGSAYPA